MTTTFTASNPPPGLEFEMERIFDAPRALVYRVWSERDLLARWWGPEGFETLSCEADVRVGGSYRVGMRAPGGTEHWQSGEYIEVVPNERLIFTYTWEDADGRPKHWMMVSVEFEDVGQQTRVRLRHRGLESAGAVTAHREGWESTFNRLAAQMESLV